MTISINASYRGNVPAHEFESVEGALAHIAANPSYEYLQGKRVRPYGDIDHYTPKGMGEFEFQCMDCAVYLALANHFEAVGKQVSLYNSSSYEAGKISWRWVVPDAYVDSQKHAKLFAQALYEAIELPEGVKADLGVYNTNQKMRMVGTSKPGEDRPLVCQNCEPIDTVITYIPEGAEYVALELPPEPVYSSEPAPTIADDAQKALLDCISVQSWTDYTICRNLIWAMRSMGVPSDTIHAYASKASNYGRAWVDGLIKSHNPSKSPDLSYVRKHAKLDNPEAYRAVQLPNPAPSPQTVKGNISELLNLSTDASTVYDHGRYLMSLPDDKTGAVKAPMSCGKTTQIKEFVRKHPGKRILILSGRRTFSDAIYGDLKDYGFVHYEHHKQKEGSRTAIACDKLIIQVSAAALKLIKDQSYDIVMMDESETLLTMMSPLNIYKKMDDYVLMYETFERIIRDSAVVWAFDAFLTDRTLNMLKALRGEVKLIINTTQPFSKTATIVKSETDFYRTLRSKLKDGKRVVSVWGTVKAGQAFHDSITRDKVPNQFYHKKSDEKVKAEHMSDVNAHWSQYQSIGYTGTITVGINYTNQEHKFDQLSLFASAWGCGARDYAQALHRAREIRDNEVIVHISSATKPCSRDAGFVAQEDIWDRQAQLTRETLEGMGELVSDYRMLPEWLKHIIIWNNNETVMNHKHFPEMMTAYLEMCGIATKEVIEGKDKKARVAGEAVSIDDVRVICAEEADFLLANRKCNSEDDSYALERYFLSNYTHTQDQFIWETWLKDRRVVEHAAMMVNDSPEDLVRQQRVKVLELVPKDVARLKMMKGLLMDWKQSWSMPVAEVPRVDLSAFSLRQRSDKETQEQYCRELAQCIEHWCGYAISVKSKRVRKGKNLDYEYTMVYDFSKSTAGYILANHSFNEE
jgi:hypothetical protein